MLYAGDRMVSVCLSDRTGDRDGTAYSTVAKTTRFKSLAGCALRRHYAVSNRANRRVGASAGAITRVLPSRFIIGLTANIEPRLGRIIVRSRRGGTHAHTHIHVREGRREGGREDGREGGREGGRVRREGGREGGRG
jgi:hypothetical protein